MRVAMIHLLVLAVLVSVVPCSRICVAQAPPTIEEELNKYGVPLTLASLRAALKDRRAVVRHLAAFELAMMRDTESVPLIVGALEAEKDENARFNMAAALVLLHSQVGNTELLRFCDDASVREDTRLNAALRLVEAGDLSCLSSVENILSQTSLLSMRIWALQILRQAKVIPASLLPRVHRSLLASLQDPDSDVRFEASRCIAAIGDKNAAPSLRTAIGKESDAQARAQMEKALEALERLP
jgi:HEAT repeat protein